MDGATILLVGGRTREVAHKAVERAPSGWMVTVSEPSRTLEQSSRFYALCTDLARSSMTWDGERRSKDDWHDLLIHAWMLATNRKPRLVAGLNGGRVSLLMGTRNMSSSMMSELIDFAVAWAVEHRIDVEVG